MVGYADMSGLLMFLRLVKQEVHCNAAYPRQGGDGHKLGVASTTFGSLSGILNNGRGVRRRRLALEKRKSLLY
jgi:hypothetical protein